MIFPGMDPYLENVFLWSGVHTSLIVYIRNQLNALIRPRYVAAIEERVFVEGPKRERIPDVLVRKRRRSKGAIAVLEADIPIVIKVPGLEIHETYIAVLDRFARDQVVTVIEVVSLTNKYAGPGRDSYQEKQREVLGSKAHLVEIDLLRGGQHVSAVPEWIVRAKSDYDYLACVNRAKGPREDFQLYPRSLRQRLPRIGIPLAGDDPDVVLDVQEVLRQTYEDGGYADRIDYRRPCRPKLSKEDRVWANQRIRKALDNSRERK
ncbi:MAG: DUF4058 family protein [Gemmataceae bacterium]|nr:DUF4058 family protein [Gemmataceae bacterium]